MKIEGSDFFQKNNLYLDLEIDLSITFEVTNTHIYDERNDKRLYWGKMSPMLRREIIEKIKQSLENHVVDIGG